MARLLSTCRPVLCMLLACSVMAQSCAPKQSSAPEMKIGMHFDAVLEFVVEYPLAWGKDRRLAYGSKKGEVRWTEPGQTGTLLRISSNPHEQQTVSEQQQIDRTLHEYVGIEISQQEKLPLPSGEAIHIKGQTVRQNVDMYLFLHIGRNYLIVLSTARDNTADYQEVMDRVVNSFQIMARQDQ